MRARTLSAILLSVVLGATGKAQQQPPDPMQLLVEVRKKVSESMSHMPRYLCTEKVERQKVGLPFSVNTNVPCPELLFAFRSHEKRLELLSSDRLRLDVAVINHHETYSWVNAGRFGDQSLSQLVQSGLTANGSFGSFLNAVFLEDAATFAYVGESQVEGRRTLQYSFSVPLSKSDYSVSNATMGKIVPYSGSFLVDAETLDLGKIEIHADDIPKALHFCEVSNVMEYAKLRVDNLDFMLPSSATTKVVNASGAQAVNHVVFSGCHQFLGESKLMFDDPTPNPSVAEAEQKFTNIPAGITFLISLGEKIDPSTMAAGDPIKGFLAKAVQIPGLNLDIPQGTLVHGRIFALLMDYSDGATMRFSVKWESMDFGHAEQPLHLALDSALPKTAKTGEVYIRQLESGFSDEVDNTVGNLEFHYVKRNYQVPVGFETRWTSLTNRKMQNR